MMRGTTPYLLIRTKLRDLTGAQVIILTIQQNGRVHNYQGDRVHIISVDEDGTLLCVHLTQEETLALCPGVYEIQISWIDASGESRKTLIGTGDILRALHRDVITLSDGTPIEPGPTPGKDIDTWNEEAFGSMQDQINFLISLQMPDIVVMDSSMSLFIHHDYYIAADGTLKEATSSGTYTTQKLPAAEGDTISLTLSESTINDRLIFAVYDKHGVLTHTLPAQGVDNYLSETYTFKPGDAFFRLSGRRLKSSHFELSYTPGQKE